MTGTAPAALGNGPGRPRDPNIEARAIHATLTTYNDHGLSGLSFARVARKAAIGKTALYRRWESVEELLIDALRAVAPPPRVEDFGSLARNLHELTLTLCDLYSGSYGRVTVRILIDASSQPALRPYYDKFVSTYVEASREIVVRGIRRGELTDDADPNLLLEQLFGATMLHVLFFASPDQQIPTAAAEQFADRLVTSLLAGLVR